MKKLMLLIMALVVMTGCDNDGTEKLSCTNTTTAANGMVTTTDLEIKYKDDEVKYITLVRDYVSREEAYDRNNVDGTNTGTDGTASDNEARARTNGNANNGTNNNGTDGMINNGDATGNGTANGTNTTGTDGMTTYNNNNNNNATTYNNDNTMDADDIVDGAVGDVIDGAIGAVTNAILDISGVRDNYSNQITNFGNIPGFSSRVEVDNANQYKVVYELDFEKIGDSDLEILKADRSLAATRSYYEDQGLTCK